MDKRLKTQATGLQEVGKCLNFGQVGRRA